MTHTVYEAKLLECRQAFTVETGTDNRPVWTFPSCSADRCAHWLMTDSHEIKPFSRIELEQSQGRPVTPEVWNEYVEAQLVAGWSSNGAVNLRNSFGNFHNTVYLCRPLPPEQQRGRCGLIPEITVEVST